MFLMNPKNILRKLDEDIVGQEEAKKSLIKTIMFNLNRLTLPKEDRKRIKKKNILLIGPTGSGKTAIARRLSEILGLPFCKVSATSFTLAGYKGSDPEAIINKFLYSHIKANFKRFADNRLRIEAIKRARRKTEEYVEERELEKTLDEESEEAQKMICRELDLAVSNAVEKDNTDSGTLEILEDKKQRKLRGRA